MRTGNLRQLTASVLGIHSVNGQRTAVMIPEGAIVELVQEPTTDARVVDVFWEGSTLALFAEDLSQRGKAIVPGSNGPVSA